jgi:PAS domain S-box-containing protein
MGHRTAAEGSRVLLLAPFGRDAASVHGLLARQGYDTHICADIGAVAEQLGPRIGVVVIAEEALRDLQPLETALSGQPDWSDVPFVVLALNRNGRAGAAELARRQLPSAVTNAIVLERPLGLASLVSAIASAMRSRQKQFELRDRLIELDEGRKALAASEAELRLIADSLPVLIAFVGRDMRYRFANRAYEDWFGRTPEDVIGRHVSELAGEDGMKARADAFRRVLSGETVQLEMAWPKPDGSLRDAEIRYLPRRDARGEIDGFHVFVLDITDRKRMQQDLERLVDERTAALTREMETRSQTEAALRQSQKMEAVGHLTGGIAHDFNNMLTGIIGSLDIMKRRMAQGRLDGLDRFMEAASTSAQRAASLTARLLAFSRRQSLDPKPLDVNGLVVSLEELLRRTIPENISLRISPCDVDAFTVADANQLENAILNLAINARDAMPDGGQLTVETRTVDVDATYAAARPGIDTGRYVVISVSDTGVGIPPDLLEKVFDPFFTTKPIGQGTGLGLSMVYGFARQSGGQVRIHSQPNLGTTVSIYLKATPSLGSHGEEQSSTRTPEGAGQTVLLVEDDPSVRLLVREVLEELGYRAVEADEPNAAIEILRSESALQLMISDVGLPGMNGRQLADIARQHRPDLPILFITGYAENAAIRAGFLGTNMQMITKPFALETLAGKVSAMLAGAGQSA